MNPLQNKIDFLLIISAEGCNPNGDPMSVMAHPRRDVNGIGEISPVCIKRKIRNRLQDLGECIFVKADDRIDDGYKSLKERAEAFPPLASELKKKKDPDIPKCINLSCEKWWDVRAFGQIFGFKGGDLVSFGVRGPVTVSIAKTIDPVAINYENYTKSTNTVPSGERKKDSQTIFGEARIDKATYIAYGSVLPCLAQKTGFSDEDADILKEALRTLFENDASYRRPSGSMASSLVWIKHDSKYGQVPTAKLVRQFKFSATETWPYYALEMPESIPGATIEFFE